jgi:hypothetical protein
VRRGLVWLALVDLRRAWPRPGLAALTIAPAVLAITFFTSQIEPRSTQVVGDLRSSRCFNFRCSALRNFVIGLPVLVAGT